ncbi:MAG: hypothetical protein R3Y30_22725, partial [Vibrio sp.]
KSSRLLWRRDRTPTSLIYRRLSPSVSIKSSYLGERLQLIDNPLADKASANVHLTFEALLQ